MDFAKFDRIAIKVEEKFKQASLVRAKTAIVMMSRTIHALRQQMLRMMFVAWKGHNAIATRNDDIMHRLITIKDIQLRSNRKELAFVLWRGHVARTIEERAQRFAIAARRCDWKRALATGIIGGLRRVLVGTAAGTSSQRRGDCGRLGKPSCGCV